MNGNICLRVREPANKLAIYVIAYDFVKMLAVPLKEKISAFHSAFPLYIIIIFYSGLISLIFLIAVSIYYEKTNNRPLDSYDPYIVLPLYWAAFSFLSPIFFRTSKWLFQLITTLHF